MACRVLLAIILGLVAFAWTVSSSKISPDDAFDVVGLGEELHDLIGLDELDEHVHVRGMATDSEQSFDYDSSIKSDENEWNEEDDGVDTSRWETEGHEDFEAGTEFDGDEEGFEEENFDVHGLSTDEDGTTEEKDTGNDDGTGNDHGSAEDEDTDDSDPYEDDDWEEFYGDESEGDEYDGDTEDVGVEGLSIEDNGGEPNTEGEDDWEDEEDWEEDEEDWEEDEEDWDGGDDPNEEDYDPEEDFDSEDGTDGVDVKGLAAVFENEGIAEGSGKRVAPEYEEIDERVVERYQNENKDIGLDNGGNDGESWVSDETEYEGDVKVHGQALVAHDEGKEWDYLESSARREHVEGEEWAKGHTERHDDGSVDIWDSDEDFANAVSGLEADVSTRAAGYGEEEESEEWDSFSRDNGNGRTEFEDGIDREGFEGAVHSVGEGDLMDDSTIDELIAFADESGREDEDGGDSDDLEEERLQGQSVVVRDGEVHDPYLVEIDDFGANRRDLKLNFADEELDLSGQSVGIMGHDIDDKFEGRGFGGEEVDVDELFESTVAAFEV